MAKPQPNDYVVLVVQGTADVLTKPTVHLSNAENLKGVRIGPIRYKFLSKKRTKLCLHCFPPLEGLSG